MEAGDHVIRLYSVARDIEAKTHHIGVLCDASADFFGVAHSAIEVEVQYSTRNRDGSDDSYFVLDNTPS